ncbi:3TM-type holin [Endozoicomonas sp. 8E]|uniref:3TM-type holin n=1 Tax=Endozoicomonas sp. 8E TaxID=3035692 RepID=UPI0029392FF3|nr:3TM-type holin [Endozoicomonas sp. 8E]WOG28736.1 3TM-type holin [Endozoicomonas sp. 8E]
MSLVAAIPVIGKVIDKLFPDANKAREARAELSKMLLNGELNELEQKAGVVKAEAQGESWLQRNWRPMVMLVFTALVVCCWMGWSAPNLTEAVELKLFSIIQMGIGGYIASRGLEKVVSTIKH